MITLDEVLALRDAIPPRYNRGDERNAERCFAALPFGRAAAQFKREHGITWQEALRARDVR